MEVDILGETHVISEDPLASFQASFGLVDANSVVLCPLYRQGGDGSGAVFTRLLRSLRPQVIVLFDPDLAVMRQVGPMKPGRRGEGGVKLEVFGSQDECVYVVRQDSMEKWREGDERE